MFVMLGLLEDMIQATARASSGGWLVLVLDAESTRIISSTLRMYDIMEQGVTCKLVTLIYPPPLLRIHLLFFWYC